MNNSVILISKDGQTVRVPLADVRVTGRTTQGVILAKLKNPKDAFTSAAVINASDAEDVIEEEITPEA
jgi:DNA gyrase subunit A